MNENISVIFDSRSSGCRQREAEMDRHTPGRSSGAAGPAGLEDGPAELESDGPTPLPEVGSEFLGFRLIGELGRGAFGRVYLARQGDLASRPVALKVATDLFDESQTLAQLQHTHIVPIYSMHRVGPLRAVCMPYLGSTTLRDVYQDLEDRGTLPVSGRGLLGALRPRRDGSGPPEGASPSNTSRHLEGLTYVQAVLWMASRLASGLAHSHERGILHRDLKPANILLTDEGQPMLLDFNLSADLKLRRGGAAIGGTSYYMSPEHLDAHRGGRGPVDARSDIYPLGIILHELLTGRQPFAMPAGAPGEIFDRLIEDRLGPPPPLRPWNRAVTPAVESIVHHCLEPDPDDRYRTAL